MKGPYLLITLCWYNQIHSICYFAIKIKANNMKFITLSDHIRCLSSSLYVEYFDFETAFSLNILDLNIVKYTTILSDSVSWIDAVKSIHEVLITFMVWHAN